MKSIGAFLILVSVIFHLTGCTSILWTFNKVNAYEYKEKNTFNDKIVSSFKYAGIKLNVKSEREGSSTIPLPQEGVGFIGENNIYFVTEGGEELLAVNGLVKQVPLVSTNDRKYIRININRSERSGVDAEFSQTLEFKVTKLATQLSLSQQSALNKNNFTLKNGYYFIQFEIKGIIINRAQIGEHFDNVETLSKGYDVQFYTHEQTDSFHVGRFLFNTALTPLTLAGDIIIYPLMLASL
ncbi:hypothetical protein [Serratia oryzae]|uniref:Uncharacterized protein n=1 Tax=Serratia oryzae TaxID=2034155 RepID=A0A1S8CMV5_9GAMM|nr:hypothetical protein [Serratia oryzae]OMQ24588.1 hypothetical protein BMI79_07120 [Serratia oryzae]